MPLNVLYELGFFKLLMGVVARDIEVPISRTFKLAFKLWLTKISSRIGLVPRAVYKTFVDGPLSEVEALMLSIGNSSSDLGLCLEFTLFFPKNSIIRIRF